jgi:hypothetical protein
MRHGRLITTALAAMAVMAISPALATAAPPPFVDDTVTDFGAGTTTGTAVVDPGSVRLNAPIAPETFDAGPGLPMGLTETQWAPPAGTATVAGGFLNVDGDRVNGAPLYDPGQVLEFRAAFADTGDEHIGFGNTLDNGPWAIFSTRDGSGLYARTRIAPDVAEVEPTLLPVSNPTAQHTYRIEWSASDVKYFVDDVLVATHSVAITAQMRPIVSDFVTDGRVVSVDSLGLMDFPSSGRLESQVFDARDANAVWGTLTAAVDMPSATNVVFETHSGQTPNPDVTWSSWTMVPNGGAITSSGRYLQYRATLSTAATATAPTPRLDRVAITYDDTTGPSTAVDPVQVSGTTATLTFSSAAADLDHFECSLDGGAFAACASPKAFSGLAAGSHTASVRGVDKLGNAGPEVAKPFTVDSPQGGGGGGGGGSGGNQQSGGSSVVADTTAPKVSLVARSLRASKRGTVSFRVGCPATETRCKVQLQLKDGKKVAAKKTVTVNGGKTVTVTLQLTTAARQALAKHGSLKVSTVFTATDAAGNHKTTTRRMTLRRAAA